MKPSGTLYGFRIESGEYINEEGAKLYLARHESGARLAYLAREDENKTFAIAFPTLPDDDTGVFHIIEHSVLCGSDNFPVKEPFVELLKSSLNTFLNALTYEDRTVYPVSSRCDKDFYNLTNVYLDAVFRPLMRKSPDVFRQEGWHIEKNDDGSHLVNGVVYNEMKGAYSSPDELAQSELSRMLFTDTLYARDSGGSPAAIPSLTYEKFISQYKKYYSAENAYIYLDGSVDLDSILPLIDSYLKEKTGGEPYRAECTTYEKNLFNTVKFPVSSDADSKPFLLLSSLFSDYKNSLELLAARIIASALTDSSEAPLKKALLDSGLVEEVSLYTNISLRQTVIIELRGIDDARAEELKALVYETIKSIAKSGIDKRLLRATLARIEFNLREADHGSLPRGIANALAAFGTWVYGGEVKDAFLYEKDIEKLKELVDTDFFDKTLLAMTVESPTRAGVLAIPDKEECVRIQSEEKERVNKLVASLSESEYEGLFAETLSMKNAQNREDTPEALASIPRLCTSDISSSVPDNEADISEYLGAKILRQKIKTDGIMYTNLYFNASDLTKDEIITLRLLSSTLANMPTENSSLIELKTAIKENLGSLSASYLPVPLLDEDDATAVYFTLSASSLTSRESELKSLITEVLLKTDFSAKDSFYKNALRLGSLCDDMLLSAPDSLAYSYCRAMLSSGGAVTEYASGISSFPYIKSLVKNFDAKANDILLSLSALAKKLFVKERLTVAIAGDVSEGFTEELISAFPSGKAAPKKSGIEKIAPTGAGIESGGGVSYALRGACVPEAKELLGPLRVARSILSFEFLWNEVRVRGGAYGAGFGTRRNGVVEMYSYRDPSPDKSILTFERCADYLRTLADSGSPIDGFIIGAFGDYDVLRTPKTEAAQEILDILCGWSREDEIAMREALLKTSADDLKKCADLVEAAMKDSAFAVAGPLESLGKVGGIERYVKATET